jgi:hemin uptake protein HemP
MSTASNAFEVARTAGAPTGSQSPHAGTAKPRGSLNSADILQGQTAVEINHNGATYRLQATRLGKLILTK